jgi:hypothetical protein
VTKESWLVSRQVQKTLLYPEVSRIKAAGASDLPLAYIWCRGKECVELCLLSAVYLYAMHVGSFPFNMLSVDLQLTADSLYCNFHENEIIVFT